MKAKNSKEIRKLYLIFIAHLSILLIISIMCWALATLAESQFISNVQAKREEINSYKNQNIALNVKIDSINTLISMINTQMISNEGALERKILQLKNEAIDKIEKIEINYKYNFNIYKKILGDIDKILETKKILQKNKEEEKISKSKLQECNNANLKLRNRK